MSASILLSDIAAQATGVSLEVSWQDHLEDGAATLDIVHRDFPFHGFDDLAGHPQSDAQPRLIFIRADGSFKLPEDARSIARRNNGAVISNPNQNVHSISRVLDAHHHLTFAAIFDSVRDEIVDDLLQRQSIPYTGQTFTSIDFDGRTGSVSARANLVGWPRLVCGIGVLWEGR